MTENPSPILEVKNLTVELHHHSILENLSFTISPGETVAVIGPNGAGKTVLFKALLGLIPHSGQISWAPDTRIGYVPQRFSVEPDLPLNVSEFFRLKNVPKSRVKDALGCVGFTDTASVLRQNLSYLSGGQLQRVLIAWAISDHPQVLLFDEPTTGVDISAEESIYNLLHRLGQQEHLTILIISHELQVVYRYATNVLCLNKSGLCFGPPHQTLTSQTLKQLFGEDTGIYTHQHPHDH
jgi:zinc transport system ATP-binding protein